jgi:hypothetical protein
MNALMSVMIFLKISNFFLQKLAGDGRRSMSQDQSQKQEVGLRQFTATGRRIYDTFFAASDV